MAGFRPGYEGEMQIEDFVPENAVQPMGQEYLNIMEEQYQQQQAFERYVAQLNNIPIEQFMKLPRQVKDQMLIQAKQQMNQKPAAPQAGIPALLNTR